MLLDLSPVCDRPIVARFDNTHMSLDGGLLALCDVELRLELAARLGGCIIDPRAPLQWRASGSLGFYAATA